MYFTRIKLENVKCFGERVILDLTNNDGSISPWTLILGDNGVGKTTLLKSVAWMMPVEAPEDDVLKVARKLKERKVDINTISYATDLSVEFIENLSITEKKRVKIKPYIDDIEGNTEFERIVRVGDSSSKIDATLSLRTKLGKVPKEKNLINHGIEVIIKDSKLDAVSLSKAELDEFESPNLFAYSANRHMALKNLDRDDLLDPIYNLFSESGDLYDAEQVLSSLDYALYREKDNDNDQSKEASPHISNLLKKVKEVLVNLLPDIATSEDIIINPPLNKDGSKNERLIEIKTPYGKVPLYDLSLGYKTMFAWVVDLALRMIWRSPKSKNPLEEPAVVIVDEIDLHLHPKWQRIIGRYLRQHFPNTQFICTAHSPIMAQSSEEDNICVLYRETGDFQVKVKNKPEVVKGWKIEEFVTSLFDIPVRSPQVTELFEKRCKLLDQKSRTSDEETKLKELDDKIGALPLEKENQDLVDEVNKLIKKFT